MTAHRLHPEHHCGTVIATYCPDCHCWHSYGQHIQEDPMPNPPRTRVVNDIGLGMTGFGDEHMADIRVYHEDGRVQVWVETDGSGITEVMQYLTADEAMAFSRAFRHCAIAALEHE